MRRGTFSVVSVLAVIAALISAPPAGAQLPEADIIFVVDESGSMGPYQNQLGTNIVTVATQLAAVTDANYGLVGYGAASPAPNTELALTDDLTALQTAISGLTTNGGIEPGYNATTHALTAGLGLRDTAGTCVVLATDERSNGDSPDQATALADAQTALANEGAFFFGLVTDETFDSGTSASYQPLATSSGGALFDLLAFNSDPTTVLDELLTTCVESIVASGTDVDVHPTSCPNPFELDRRGMVPAAILGSETLDVTTIDTSTVELVGPGGSASAIRWSIEDVAGPDEFPQPELRDECGTDGPDGFDDLTLKFSAAEVQDVLGPVEPGDTVVVTITGETFEGATVSGVDIVWIR